MVPPLGVVVGVSRIRQLPDDLANQIAAGEVVERPASVVKELVENAIDAEAVRIAVTVEYGGKRLIRVEDDGIGMSPEDARLCLERHATSKIATAADLAAIATLGFRGEALPSIASVSRFSLRTRTRDAVAGTEIRVTAGQVEPPRAAGAPEGTAVTVEDLFFNLPARRKFLKSDAAETAHVSRIVTQLALCHPHVGFTLTSAGRPLLRCPPARSPADRLFQIYGDRPDLVAVSRQAHGAALHRRGRGAGRARADARPAARLRQPPRRPRQDDRARDPRRLPVGLDQGAESGSAPLPRGAARPRRRQRPSDQGRGPLRRPVAGPRAGAPRS